MALVWSPDGTRLASYMSDTFTLWDAAGGTELHTIRGQQGGVICIAFTADGTRLASGGADKTIKLWKTSDGSAAGRLEGHTDRVGCLVALPDGRLLSGSGDGTVRVWSP